MKLYHYAPIDHTVMRDGLLSVSNNPLGLKSYFKRAGSENKDEVILWLEQTFDGRSRAISCLTEPIKWQGNDPVLKAFVERSVLFSFELDDLLKDGLVEAVWCKEGSSACGFDERFLKVRPDDIDASPLLWEKCDSAKGLLFGAVRHYLVVVKDGMIEPKYLKQEK